MSNIGRENERLTSLGHVLIFVDDPSQTEIGYFHYAIVADENISGGQISMNLTAKRPLTSSMLFGQLT
jgi:hypothetical protein